MITFFRWYRMKAKEIKWKLIFWQLVDRHAAQLVKHPEEFEKALVRRLAGILHDTEEEEKILNPSARHETQGEER